MRAFIVLTGIVQFSCVVSAQSPPSFEVASIRPHQDPPEGTPRRVGISVSGSRVGATAVGVRGLIGFAYGLDIDGELPKDVESQRYDVAAQAGGDVALTREQAQQMMQTLLADRFQLKYHLGSKEVPVYLLRVAKKGPKLKDGPPDTRSSMRILSPTKSLDVEADFFKWSTEQLAGWMGAIVGRPVWDRTGLTGAYDFTLKYTADSGTSGGPDATASDPSGPSIFTALAEQLGLTLESGKGTLQTIIVDHVARPSEN